MDKGGKLMPNSNKKKTCFIITPIGKINSAIRRKIDGLISEVISPVMNELDYEIEVSHKISESGLMTKAIIQRVYNSDLVIANLTGNNPNVMYEVALRHASAKPIIHITEDIHDLPFDISNQRTIEYIDDMSGAQELKDNLRKMVQGIKLDDVVDNPITSALEKRKIINIPSGNSVDAETILVNILDEMQTIKRNFFMLRGNDSYNKRRIAKERSQNEKNTNFEDFYEVANIFELMEDRQKMV